MREPGASWTRSNVPGVSSTSLAQAVSGTYQMEQIGLGPLDLTAATEYEITEVAANILANTANKDEVFSWVKGVIFTCETAQGYLMEWWLLRLNQADADPDLDDEAAVEILQKDKRILKRGYVTGGDMDYNGLKKIEFEIYQLKLRYGEELRLLILPKIVGAAQWFVGRIEWRQQGK